MPETATEKARRLRDEKRQASAAKRTSPGSTSSKPASLLPLASKSPTKGTTKLGALGRSTSTSGTSASGPRKSRPGGVSLEVGGYVSVSGKTKPAMLQMDNDDGTWDVEYLGGEEDKVPESKMRKAGAAAEAEAEKQRHEEEAAKALEMQKEEDTRTKAAVEKRAQEKLAEAAKQSKAKEERMLEQRKERQEKEKREAQAEADYRARLAAAGWEMHHDEQGTP